jgi:hypothetical protein
LEQRHYAPATINLRIGSSLTVSWVDYLKSARSKDITLHVKRGWLGLPWFEGIEVGHQACPVYRISRVIGFGNPRLNSFHRPTIGQEPPSTNYTNYLTRGTLLVRDTKRVTWTMTIARNWLIHSAV